MNSDLAAELASLEKQNLLRAPHLVSGSQGRSITIDGRQVLCFSSNNYLGLANHPELIEAVRSSVLEDGVGAGASRLISGTMEAHVAAETRIARFLGTQAALLFSSGYATNVGVITALLREGDVVFSDALNHASIIDACRLSKATIHVFAHRDETALAELLAEHRSGARRALVVSDALFSMEGDRAPLERLRQLADAADAWLMVDEAHSLGLFGPGGRGLSAETGVRPEILVGTLGKAIGVSGAFVAGSAKLIAQLTNRARSFVFSTAPPPALAAAVTRAVDLVEAGDDLRSRTLEHARRLRQGLAEQGYEVRGDGSQIVPVLLGHPKTTMDVSEALLARGIFAHGIRPPTVPAGTSRIRVALMAAHEEQDIDRALEAFREVRKELLSK